MAVIKRKLSECQTPEELAYYLVLLRHPEMTAQRGQTTLDEVLDAAATVTAPRDEINFSDPFGEKSE